MELQKRTITRIGLWRICAYIGTSVIIYIATKSITQAISFGLIDHSIKFVCQYVYERLWNKIKWGIIVDIKQNETKNTDDQDNV